MDQKYNSIIGIENYLKDLKGLNDLIHDRHEAGYVRNERMNEYIILGRWVLDGCGNCSKIIADYGRSIIPQLSIPLCPKVMLYKDCFNKIGENASICSNFEHDIPTNYSKCVACETEWTIKNAHDCITKSNTELVDGDIFIGQKLGEIKHIPKYVNNYQHYISTNSIRPKSLSKGSIPADKDYIVTEGDTLFVTVWKNYHIYCNDLGIIKYVTDAMVKVIDDTGFLLHSDYTLTLVKNKYDESRKDPWFRLIFENYEILIGWRKSVININWEKSNKDLSHLFENEKVTKGPSMIHAYGYEKATEYLKKIIPGLVD